MQKLKGTQLQDAAVKAGFDASFVALVLFPQVVAKMAEQIAWTTVLGQSFTADRNAVFASIQKLRAQAKNVGTLKSTPQQAVETKKTSSGEEVIVIEPTNPQIVYVPTYDTQVVYTQAPTTIVIQEDDDDADVAVAAGLIGFTAGIAIGATMDNHYYYGPYGWHGGGYMYNDAWDDYYDHREDAREDYLDHREDIVEDRNDRLEDRSEQRNDRVENTQEQRTDRQENRQENRPESQGQRAQAQGTQAQRTERSTQAQGAATQRATTQSATTAQTRTGSPEARGYSTGTQSPAVQQRSSGSSDAFSGYSNGQSQRASSTRGQQSRGSSSRSRAAAVAAAAGGAGDDAPRPDRSGVHRVRWLPSSRPRPGRRPVRTGPSPRLKRPPRRSSRSSRPGMLDGVAGGVRAGWQGVDRLVRPRGRASEPAGLFHRGARAMASGGRGPRSKDAGHRLRGVAVPRAAGERRQRMAVRHGGGEGRSAGAADRAQRAVGDRNRPCLCERAAALRAAGTRRQATGGVRREVPERSREGKRPVLADRARSEAESTGGPGGRSRGGGTPGGR